MKTALIVLATLAVTACGIKKATTSSVEASNSKALVCGTKAKNGMVVKFDRQNMKATLTTAQGDSYESHTCGQEEGAIEASYACSFFSSTDSGYSVRIASIGSAALYGSVTPWTMTGEGKAISLGECK